MAVHYCGICMQPVPELSPMNHMNDHTAMIDVLNQWSQLLDLPEQEEEALQHEHEEHWRKVSNEMQENRCSAEEAELQLEGISLLSKLLHGIEKVTLIPFGSSVIGTSEKGKSDTDVSVYTPSMTMLHFTLSGIKFNKYGRIVGEKGAERKRLETVYGVHLHIPSPDLPGPILVVANIENEKKARDCIKEIMQLLPDYGRSVGITREQIHADEKSILSCVNRRLQSILHPPCTQYLDRLKIPIMRIQGSSVQPLEDTLHFPDLEQADIALHHLQATQRYGDAELLSRDLIRFPNTASMLEALHLLESKGIRVQMELPKCLASEWDITARPHFGPRNSKLLRKILGFVGETALVACCLIKRWGKQHMISDTRSGYMSSYSLVLMFCFYLQQEGHVKYVGHGDVTMDSTDMPSPMTPSTLTDEDHKQIMNLTVGFFRYYTKFDWSSRAVTLAVPPDTVVSPEQLGFTEESMLATLEEHISSHVHGNFVVYDPYEHVNTARRVSVSKAIYVKGMFKLTYLMLVGKCCASSYKERLQLLFESDAVSPTSGVPWHMLGVRAPPQGRAVDVRKLFLPALPPHLTAPTAAVPILPFGPSVGLPSAPVAPQVMHVAYRTPPTAVRVDPVALPLQKPVPSAPVEETESLVDLNSLLQDLRASGVSF